MIFFSILYLIGRCGGPGGGGEAKPRGGMVNGFVMMRLHIEHRLRLMGGGEGGRRGRAASSAVVGAAVFINFLLAHYEIDCQLVLSFSVVACFLLLGRTIPPPSLLIVDQITSIVLLYLLPPLVEWGVGRKLT